MTLCICIAPGPVGSRSAPHGSNRVLPPRRGDRQTPEVERESDGGSEATEGGGGLQQELVVPALEHIGGDWRGDRSASGDAAQALIARDCVLGREMLTCSTSKALPDPLLQGQEGFFVSKVFKKSRDR